MPDKYLEDVTHALPGACAVAPNQVSHEDLYAHLPGDTKTCPFCLKPFSVIVGNNVERRKQEDHHIWQRRQSERTQQTQRGGIIHKMTPGSEDAQDTYVQDFVNSTDKRPIMKRPDMMVSTRSSNFLGRKQQRHIHELAHKEGNSLLEDDSDPASSAALEGFNLAKRKHAKKQIPRLPSYTRSRGKRKLTIHIYSCLFYLVDMSGQITIRPGNRKNELTIEVTIPAMGSSMSLQDWLEDKIIAECPSPWPAVFAAAHSYTFVKRIRKLKTSIEITYIPSYRYLTVNDLYDDELMPWKIMRNITTRDTYSGYVVVFHQEVDGPLLQRPVEKTEKSAVSSSVSSMPPVRSASSSISIPPRIAVNCHPPYVGDEVWWKDPWSSASQTSHAVSKPRPPTLSPFETPTSVHKPQLPIPSSQNHAPQPDYKLDRMLNEEHSKSALYSASPASPTPGNNVGLVNNFDDDDDDDDFPSIEHLVSQKLARTHTKSGQPAPLPQQQNHIVASPTTSPIRTIEAPCISNENQGTNTIDTFLVAPPRSDSIISQNASPQRTEGQDSTVPEQPPTLQENPLPAVQDDTRSAGGPNVDGNGPLAFGDGSPNVDVTVSPQLEHTPDTTRKRKASQTQDNRAQLPKYCGRVTRSKAKATHIV